MVARRNSLRRCNNKVQPSTRRAACKRSSAGCKQGRNANSSFITTPVDETRAEFTTATSSPWTTRRRGEAVRPPYHRSSLSVTDLMAVASRPHHDSFKRKMLSQIGNFSSEYWDEMASFLEKQEEEEEEERSTHN